MFMQFCFLIAQLFPTARWAQLLLPFYPFTFLPLYIFSVFSLSTLSFSLKNNGESFLVMFMYKMLTDCGFSFIKSEKLRTKMFHSAKKVSKIPPHSFFFLTFAPRKCELSCKRLIYIITYLCSKNEINK